MMKKTFGYIAAILLVLACTFPAAAKNSFAAAPLAADFLEYQREISSSGKAGTLSGPGGYIPSPIDLSHLRSADYSSQGRGAVVLPRKFDLREHNGVTPAGNQENYSVCWAFTSMGSLESTYLRTSGKALDLSELHIASAAFNDSQPFDGGVSDGGYDNHSVAVLARWDGPVLQSDIPGGGMPTGPASAYKDRLHLENAYFLAFQFLPVFQRSTDDVRKRLIYERGGISVGLKVDSASENSPYYNKITNAWYFNGRETRPNHAVLLVGWNDDFPRTNFSAGNMPRGNGAWLAKNSWGRGFGDDGFFWISYEDLGVGDGTVYLAGESDNYDINYGYDHLGWCNSIGQDYPYSDTAWMANLFRSSGYRETLEAVSFYTTSNGASYEIYVYTNITNLSNPTGGILAAPVQAGTEEFSGYHTVKLKQSVSLSANTTFSVVVKMTTPGFNFPIPAELKMENYSSKAVIESGVSFISFDGKSWEDTGVGNANENGNVCLRAFTSTTGPVDSPIYTNPNNPIYINPNNPIYTDPNNPIYIDPNNPSPTPVLPPENIVPPQGGSSASNSGGGGCSSGAGAFAALIVLGIIAIVRHRSLIC
ncbi:MAG: lectin like domain-containing protein [Synergistaceae bacterium]|jgi:C1A family cysteine protease|nr:lectin like domain-containing protein [Synergistaceae bacterium]